MVLEILHTMIIFVDKLGLFLLFRLSSIEIVFHQGHLPLKLSSIGAVLFLQPSQPHVSELFAYYHSEPGRTEVFQIFACA